MSVKKGLGDVQFLVRLKDSIHSFLKNKKSIRNFIKEKTIKTATSGTVKLFLRQGFIQSLPKGTTAGMFSHVVFVLIENSKVVKSILRKEISLGDGLEDITQRSLSLMGGLISIGNGTLLGGALGAMLGLTIPYLGNWSILLGSFIGSAIGYAIGSKLGHLLFYPLKRIWSCVFLKKLSLFRKKEK